MNVRIVAMDVITTDHREIKTSVQTRVPACSKASVHIRSLSLMRPLGTGGVTTEHRRAHLTTTRCHARVSCVPFVIEHPILHNCRDSSHICPATTKGHRARARPPRILFATSSLESRCGGGTRVAMQQADICGRLSAPVRKFGKVFRTPPADVSAPPLLDGAPPLDGAPV